MPRPAAAVNPLLALLLSLGPGSPGVWAQSPPGAGGATGSPTAPPPTATSPTHLPTINPTIAPTIFRDRTGLAQFEQSRWPVPLSRAEASRGGKWSGAVYSPATGKVYGMPAGSTSVLVIDPATGAVDTVDFTPLQGDVNTPRWAGGVLDPATGKIFAIPARSNNILIFDPATNVTDASAIRSPRRNDGRKWSGGVLDTRTGLIFGVPAFAGGFNVVLVIDPTSNATASPSVNNVGFITPVVNGRIWTGGVHDPASGKIFCMPSTTSTAVLALDVSPRAGSTIAGPLGQPEYMQVPQDAGGVAQRQSWVGGAYDTNSGRIFGVPGPGTLDLLVITPMLGSLELVRIHRSFHPDVVSESARVAWWGAVYHRWSGNVVAIPQAGPALVVDLGSLATAAASGVSGQSLRTTPGAAWAGGAFHPQTGRIIGVPFDSDSVLVIESSDALPPATTTAAITASTITTPAQTSSIVTTGRITSPPMTQPTVPPVSITVGPGVTTPAGFGATNRGSSNDSNGSNGRGEVAIISGIFGVLIIILIGMLVRSKRSRARLGKWTPYEAKDSIVNPTFATEAGDELPHRTLSTGGHVGGDTAAFASPEVQAPTDYVPLSTVMHLNRDQAAAVMKGFSSGAFVIRPSARSSSGKAMTLLFDQYGVMQTAQFAISKDASGVYVGGDYQTERFADLETLLTAACIQDVPPFPCTLCPLPDDTVSRYSDAASAAKFKPQLALIPTPTPAGFKGRAVWGDGGTPADLNPTVPARSAASLVRRPNSEVGSPDPRNEAAQTGAVGRRDSFRGFGDEVEERLPTEVAAATVANPGNASIPGDLTQRWECGACMLLNSGNEPNCDACQAPRPDGATVNAGDGKGLGSEALETFGQDAESSNGARDMLDQPRFGGIASITSSPGVGAADGHPAGSIAGSDTPDDEALESICGFESSSDAGSRRGSVYDAFGEGVDTGGPSPANVDSARTHGERIDPNGYRSLDGPVLPDASSARNDASTAVMLVDRVSALRLTAIASERSMPEKVPRPNADPIPALAMETYLTQLSDFHRKHTPGTKTEADLTPVAARCVVNGTGWLDGPLRKKYGQSLTEFLKAGAEPGSAALGAIGQPNRPAGHAAEIVPARLAALNSPMHANPGLGDTSATADDVDDGYLQVSSGPLSPEEELMVIDNTGSGAGIEL